MATRFPNLFSSIQVGKRTLSNRIVCTGHATAFDSDGLFTERHLHYYRERARGGVGMIITEPVGVDPTSTLPIGLYDDAATSMLQRIAAAVHGYSTPILVQITHAGRRVPSPAGVPETVAVAPSAIPAPGHRLRADDAPRAVHPGGWRPRAGLRRGCRAGPRSGDGWRRGLHSLRQPHPPVSCRVQQSADR